MMATIAILGIYQSPVPKTLNSLKIPARPHQGISAVPAAPEPAEPAEAEGASGGLASLFFWGGGGGGGGVRV